MPYWEQLGGRYWTTLLNTQDFKNVSGETMIRSVLKKIKKKLQNF